MRRLLSICIISFSTYIHATNSQYHPFIEEGKEWEVLVSPSSGSEYTEKYFFDGDTVIAGMTCKKMLCQYDATMAAYYGAAPVYVAALYEADEKVWIFNPDTEQAVLLYDFGANTGDMLDIGKPGQGRYALDTSPCRITDVQSVERKGTERRYIFIQNGSSPGTGIDIRKYWIEGIGTSKGPLMNSHFNSYGSDRFMHCCKVNEEVIYDTSCYPTALFTRQADVRDNGGIPPQPFITEGKKWIVGEKDGNSNHFNRITTYYFDGEVTVAGHTCARMMASVEDEDGEMATPILTAYVFEKDRQVWAISPSETEPVMLYDFGHYSGDEITVARIDADHQSSTFTVGYGNPYEHDGIRYRSYAFKSSYVSRWTEGIGGWSAPLRNFHLESDSTQEELLAVTSGPDTIYIAPQRLQLAYDNVRQGLHYFRDTDSYYRPFIEDGKIWELIDRDVDGTIVQQRTCYFGQDTVVAGIQCKQLMEHSIALSDGTATQRLLGVLFEEECKVWCFVPGESSPRLVYDFAARKGDSLALANPLPDMWTERALKIRDLDKKRSYGLVLGHYSWEKPDDIVEHRHWYSLNNDIYLQRYVTDRYWIPGVGSVSGPIFNHPNGHSSGTLVRCYVGDDVVYLNQAYYSQWISTAIRDIPQSPSAADANSSFVNRHSSSLYDLQGRRLSAPPAKGMYIQDKRVKILCR